MGGVTLFFVLSGFLITTLLGEERADHGRVKILAFYRRRARRLLPALLAFVAVVVVWMTITGRGGRAASDAVPTLLYVANIAQAAGHDNGLFDHTWSLALEEQFYLVWPLAYLAIAAWPWRRAASVLLVLAIASATLRLAFAENLDRISWAPDTRADAILVGCLLALWLQRSPTWRPTRLLIAIAVIALVAPSMIGSWREMASFGLPLMVLGSAVLVASGLDGPRWLAWAPLAWVGVISYGLYLWHLPVLRDGSELLLPLNLPGGIGAATLIVVTFAIAGVSRRYIEVPFLRLRHRKSARTRLREPEASTAKPVKT